MDRRYYILKGFVLAVAIAAATSFGGFASPQSTRPVIRDTQYQAAAMVQTVLHDTGIRVARAVSRLVSCPRQVLF
jgi:hypothetical protein